MEAEADAGCAAVSALWAIQIGVRTKAAMAKSCVLRMDSSYSRSNNSSFSAKQKFTPPAMGSAGISCLFQGTALLRAA
jgi:hypothetical protein